MDLKASKSGLRNSNSLVSSIITPTFYHLNVVFGRPMNRVELEELVRVYETVGHGEYLSSAAMGFS